MPGIIQSISTIITEISTLSTSTLTPKKKLEDQQALLKTALTKLSEATEAIPKIGERLESYEIVYTAAIEEMTHVRAFKNEFANYQALNPAAKLAAWFSFNESIGRQFEVLQDFDSDLDKAIKTHALRIEEEDLANIKNARNYIDTDLTCATLNLKTARDSLKQECLNAAHEDTYKIEKELIKISSILNAHFMKVSDAMKEIAKMQATLGQIT